MSEQTQSLLAAEYVRMSTEHQKYSTENQSQVIRDYANRRGIRIVQTYADHGKSGLRVDGRDALQQLIADVRAGGCNFSLILVYDVSRWGRFQDADESAYYEFICKQAGITVHYCAEQFENDGSLSATIIKGMKRAMAGEYSRELSTKVFAGQCRLITLGFRQGGPAGYGLRRQLIDDQRHPKGELAMGERKSLQTDRVILVPGPEQEISTVRRIYHMFVEGQSERDIAFTLNAEGLRSDRNRWWTRGTIHQVLTNEKYVGDNVYNRTSFKLKKRRVRNPPDMWIRSNGAFTPVVQPTLFEAVRRIVQDRGRRYSNDELLDRLTTLLKTTGWLSGLIIDERDDMPSSSVYRNRFGSLVKAYQLVGFSPGRDFDYVEINRVLRRLHCHVVQEIVRTIGTTGGSAHLDPNTDLMVVNDEFTTSIVIARCSINATGLRRWKLRLDASLRPDITLGVRMDGDNRLPLDYYLFPRIDVASTAVRLAESNGFWLDAYRFDALEAFFELAARTRLKGVA